MSLPAAIPLAVRGLSTIEANEELIRSGKNALPAAPQRRLVQRIFAQLESALSLLLLGAAVLDLGLWMSQGSGGSPFEPLAIFAVLAINTVLGVLQEYRSERALSALQTLGQPLTWVLRDGTLVRVPTETIVPGDRVTIEAGDRVPADGTLLEQASLAIDESVLTGESLPVEKSTGDAVSSGTLVVRGNALALITATGVNSAMGRLAGKLAGIQVGRTPLERRLDEFGRRISWIAGALVVLLILLGLASEGWSRIGSVVTFAIALAVAIVPEGMTAVVALSLAIGVERMARKRAIVRRLAAVETLGSVTVIATDKTGTLTENRLHVAEVFAHDEQALIETAVLANDSDPDNDHGDPLDVALLEYARSRGLDVAGLRRANVRVSSRPFDSAWRYTRVTVRGPAGPVSHLKGAFEVLLTRACMSCSEAERLHAIHERESVSGRRVIALGRALGESDDDIELLGLIAVWDPPRVGVRDAITRVREAGARVVMVTGDHPVTARAIADQVGLVGGSVVTGDELRGLTADERARRITRAGVIARVTAEDKLSIVESLQSQGEVVAMTGDGVNDAPALKRADIGIAMGQRGSDVAREVSDLVLLDDEFRTIVGAVAEGRNIHDNIQKFIRFTFSTNVALAIVVLGGTVGAYLLGSRDASGALILPLTAIQVLFINFVGDGPPALALAVDTNPTVMQRPPRAPTSALLDRAGVRFILSMGVLQGSTGLLLLGVLPTFGFELRATQALVFLYESTAKVLSVYPARRLSGKPGYNRALHTAVAFGIGVSLAAVYVPALQSALGLEPPPLLGVVIVAWCVLSTWGAAELLVRVGHRIRRP
jgi:Ca2+-transporting ATPase